MFLPLSSNSASHVFPSVFAFFKWSISSSKPSLIIPPSLIGIGGSSSIEEREREKTGIKNLRVRFNKVFGYYIEVTNSYKDLVPDYYIRRQTLANAERYTTEELSELARTILGAEDKLYALEYETYVAIREKLASEMERIQKTACVIAWTDVFASLALVAEANICTTDP